LRQVKTGK